MRAENGSNTLVEVGVGIYEDFMREIWEGRLFTGTNARNNEVYIAEVPAGVAGVDKLSSGVVTGVGEAGVADYVEQCAVAVGGSIDPEVRKGVYLALHVSTQLAGGMLNG